jgi:hypothetical protein
VPPLASPCLFVVGTGHPGHPGPSRKLEFAGLAISGDRSFPLPPRQF